MDSNTWTHQCSSTCKYFRTLYFCGHEMQSRGPAGNDGERERERERAKRLRAIGCNTNVKYPNLPCDLSIAGGRIVVFIPFPRELVPWEMQTAWTRTWTRLVTSTSYDDNRYPTCTSICLQNILSVYLTLSKFRDTFKVLQWYLLSVYLIFCFIWNI